MSLSPAFPGMFPAGTSHVRDRCVPMCSSSTASAQLGLWQFLLLFLHCNSLRPCQFLTPFPSCRAPLPWNWVQGWALHSSCPSSVMGACWGSPGPEPLGQHSLAMGSTACLGSAGGQRGQGSVPWWPPRCCGHAEVPRGARGATGSPWPARGFRGFRDCPGSGEVLEAAWGRGSLGRDVSPMDIDELLSLEKGSDPGSCCPVIPPGLWALLGLYMNFSEPCLSPGLFLVFCSFSK